MAPPRVEVVHVGSACRDIAPDDPRGWRLGGGVTYASLTTARLGLRTAAIVGVDATAATASELDLLREAGVDLLLVPLDEGPIFHNQETPTGRVQTCVQVGVPLPVPALPESWLAAPGWSVVPVAGEVVDAWAAIVPDDAHLAVAWQGFLRTLVPGERVMRRPPSSSSIIVRADLVGVSHHDVPPETPLADAVRTCSIRARTCSSRSATWAGCSSTKAATDGPRRSATCPPRPTARAIRRAPVTPSWPPSRRRSFGRPSSAGVARAIGSTCASRPRQARWSSRVPGSMACPTAPRWSSVVPASGSGARSCRARSPRSASSARSDRVSRP